MKIKEITYIHAEAAPGGELKHGSIALIDRGTPVIIFAPHDDTYDSMISNAMEVKARGALVIGVSDAPHPCFDAYLPVEDRHGLWILPATIVVQLLAYHLAVALHRDPDKPRNLAKSVTVK
jgi:glucosamine--fructose-6-phosphate aminotransferase (isomerizing)